MIGGSGGCARAWGGVSEAHSAHLLPPVPGQPLPANVYAAGWMRLQPVPMPKHMTNPKLRPIEPVAPVPKRRVVVLLLETASSG